ncbi:hypothetical protein ATE49_15555 [Elizabethkingia miricola]|uniref:Uncharacterized protein n=1 Tax=Elizabethkingia miricola TaxID=172045 RepID=A0ABY3NBC9_ELIMR|nr:hypothetical protein [Elizabethkingia miricola]OBS12776.1 hypothetical protein ATE49_15555 [Elizabethkingia miricola]TYO83557.1 hypothetical protein LX74_04071 [Elizabethkingia miricola]
MKTISRSHAVQKKMNNILAQRHISQASYQKAYTYYVEMNKLREDEGLSVLTMPNLEKRVKSIIK